jgi:hypothetical protein
MVTARLVPAGLGQPEDWPWAEQAVLGPVSPVAMGYNAAHVNSEVSRFSIGLIQIQCNPIQF